MSVITLFDERAKKLQEENCLSLRGALLKIAALQSDKNWYETLKTKLAIRIVNATQLPQSKFYSWLKSSGAAKVVNEKHGIGKILHAVPLFVTEIDKNKGVMAILMGDEYIDCVILEDLDFIVERVVRLMMKNWQTEWRFGDNDFETASQVRNSEFQASQQMLKRIKTRAFL